MSDVQAGPLLTEKQGEAWEHVGIDRQDLSEPRNSHGGTRLRIGHKPFFASRASFSSFSSSTSRSAYLGYHQHTPCLTSSWLTFIPSGRITSPRVRVYLSWPWVWMVTSLPKARTEAACNRLSTLLWRNFLVGDNYLSSGDIWKQ